MNADKVWLNKNNYSVRARQAMLEYGIGAMVDFQDQTLMTAEADRWSDAVTKIYDGRLSKILHVDFFGLPDGDNKKGISYVRFPEWYFCPKCRKFMPIKQWVKLYQKGNSKNTENDKYMVHHPKCPVCKRDLVATRIVSVCEHGHIDDFPWVKWVHCQNRFGSRPVCSHPELQIKSRGFSDSIASLTVSCQCGATATLKGIFDSHIFENLDKKHGEDTYGFKCTGRHPWKHSSEECKCYPEVLQRGSSSVYFPVTVSSLVIPPYSSVLTKMIEGSSSYEDFHKALEVCRKYNVSAIDNCVNDFSQTIAENIGVRKEDVLDFLNHEIRSEEPDGSNYKREEYDALSGTMSINDNKGDFVVEIKNIEEYGLNCIKKITLVHKIREVQALLGFSRIEPIDNVVDALKKGNNNFVSIKPRGKNWYPAYEVRGEGIFIELDDNLIKEWEKNPLVQKRVDLLRNNCAKSYTCKDRKHYVTSKFLLLHSIAHLLIKQLSVECGYSIASLKERIYCSEKDEGKVMSGFFIYTASGDSEGTLGGLVRQGYQDVFPHIFTNAIESIIACSNDPVCSVSKGQGRDSLNLAACYSCLLIPETSCEQYNTFLDRGVVVGTLDNQDIGFFSRQLYYGEKWGTVTEKKEVKVIPKKYQFYVEDCGLDLNGLKYYEIWDNVLESAENDEEITILEALKANADKFVMKEKPSQGCKFLVEICGEKYQCDLYWKKSQVAIFSADNCEAYEAAKRTNVKCYLLSDNTWSWNDILENLEE